MIENEFQCIKIKDGLYMGNLQAAQDYQFLVINKFSHIVNCNAQMPNHYELMGIKYLKFKLIKQKPHKLFNESLKKLSKLQAFIQDSQQNMMCCLVVSQQNNTRSLVMVTAFLMSRFRWTMRKTLEYIRSKGIYISLNDHYVNQLQILQQILSNLQDLPRLSQEWKGPYTSEQQQIISKTFLNSQQIPTDFMNNGQKKQKKTKRVIWKDKFEKQNKKAQKQKKTKDIKQGNQKSIQLKVNRQKDQNNLENENNKSKNLAQKNITQKQRKSLTSNILQKKVFNNNFMNSNCDSNQSLGPKLKGSKQKRQKRIGNKSSSLNKISIHSQKGTNNVQSQHKLQKVITEQQYESFKQGQEEVLNKNNNIVNKKELIKIIQNNLKISKNNLSMKNAKQQKQQMIQQKHSSSKKSNKQPNSQQNTNQIFQNKEQPVYNLTINNFINPNIHILNQVKKKSDKQEVKVSKKSKQLNKKKNNQTGQKNNQKTQKNDFKKTGLLNKNSRNKQKNNVNNQNVLENNSIKQKLSKAISVQWKKNKLS